MLWSSGHQTTARGLDPAREVILSGQPDVAEIKATTTVTQKSYQIFYERLTLLLLNLVLPNIVLF